MPLERVDGWCLTQESCADPFLAVVVVASLALASLSIPASHEKNQEDPSVPWLPFLPCSLQGTQAQTKGSLLPGAAAPPEEVPPPKAPPWPRVPHSGALSWGDTGNFASEP